MEARQLLATDGFAPVIQGTVFQDQNANGTPSAGEGIAGITLQLFRDDGDAVFQPNGGDVQVGADLLTDANGEYCFDGLDPDAAYFVYRPAQSYSATTLPAQSSVLLRPGEVATVIDHFETAQAATASPPAPSSATTVLTFANESEVLGRERDLFAELFTGNGAVGVSVVDGVLRFNSGDTVDGRATIAWDGVDVNAGTITMGLGGRDLTGDGSETGIVLRIGALLPDTTAVLYLHQGNEDNFLSREIQIPATNGGAADEYLFLPYATFTGPVQPSDVDAVSLELFAQETAANQVEIALIGTNGPRVADFEIEPIADLAISKTDHRADAIPGEQLTYTITVSNNGPSSANGVSVTDLFPSELDNVSFTSAATGAASGNTPSGIGDLGDTLSMAPGSSVTYTVTGRVASSATGTLTNIAQVVAPSGTTDPNPNNNNAIDIDNLTPTADLSLTKTDNADSSQPGQAVAYTIEVRNEGPSDVVGATVTDLLAGAGLENVTYTSSVVGAVSGNSASGSGDISDVVSMAAGSTLTYVVNATVAADLSGELRNEASVSVPTGTIDPDPQNNVSVDTNVVTPQVDLSIDATDEVTAVAPNQQITYTIVVRNDGPDIATGARVRNDFSNQLVNVSYTSSATPGVTGQTATGSGSIDDVVTLPAGSTLTYTATATVSSTANGSIQNLATVTAPVGSTDTDTSNNVSTDQNSVSPVFDLAISLANASATVVAGQSTTYTVTVTNTGPTTVTDAIVATDLSQQLTAGAFTSVASGGASGNTATGSGEIQDTVQLPAGSTIIYTLLAAVASSADGPITSSATITSSSPQDEVDLTNNSATDQDTIVREADLRATLTNGQDSLTPGEAATYQIVVTNLGPSDVSGVRVTNSLTAGLNEVTHTSTAAGGATGNTNGSGLIDQVLTLPAGSSVTYSLQGTVASDAGGSITNSVQVQAPDGVTETNAIDNQASDTDPIDRELHAISGYVYVDLNNNGRFDTGEQPITGVAFALSGTDSLGNPVSRTATSNGSGQYRFAQLLSGVYTVRQQQPAPFGDGRETIGTGSTTNVVATDNVFANIGLAGGQDATGFNFGETRPMVSKRDLLSSRF